MSIRKPLEMIIDTDIGDDIDDAFALCIAMRSPEIHLAGVTTVFRQPEKRAQIAARLLRLGRAGCVPVCAGASHPLSGGLLYGERINYDQAPAAYTAAYDREAYNDEEHACDFIIRTAKSAEAPLVITTLGPLTNIAMALLKYPGLKDHIRCIHAMGGAFFRIMHAEYNFACDPEAAEIVLKSGIPVRCVGLDVTFPCMLKEADILRLQEMRSPCIRALMDMRAGWPGHVILHDPAALVSTFRQDLITFRRIRCEIETQGKYTRGMSVNTSGFAWGQSPKNSSVEAACTARTQQLMALCMERLLTYGSCQ